jgi:zinc-ribbon domain
MAGFCTKCGSSLPDGQGFCTKCGTAVSGAPLRPAAQPAAPSATASAAPAKGGSSVVKILLICAALVVFLGIVGLAGLVYLGHRYKKELHQMGVDDQSNYVYHGPVLGGVDPCSLLSQEEVGQVVKMEVVRAEKTQGPNVGCEYSVMGNRDELVAKHISRVHKEQSTESQRQEMEGLLASLRAQKIETGDYSRHPGETPVFLFNVDNNAAKMQMGVMHVMLAHMSPGTLTTLPDIGDDAFDIGSTMIMARKGDTLVRAIYLACPCNTDDAVPLLKKIVSKM